MRFTIRQLRKNPAFAVTTILNLAMGIGATTAIFSLINAVLPERLMWVNRETAAAERFGGIRRRPRLLPL